MNCISKHFRQIPANRHNLVEPYWHTQIFQARHLRSRYRCMSTTHRQGGGLRINSPHGADVVSFNVLFVRTLFGFCQVKDAWVFQQVVGKVALRCGKRNGNPHPTAEAAGNLHAALPWLMPTASSATAMRPIKRWLPIPQAALRLRGVL